MRHPLTVGQIFYRLTAEGVIPKAEIAYKMGSAMRLGGSREVEPYV